MFPDIVARLHSDICLTALHDINLDNTSSPTDVNKSFCIRKSSFSLTITFTNRNLNGPWAFQDDHICKLYFWKFLPIFIPYFCTVKPWHVYFITYLTYTSKTNIYNSRNLSPCTVRSTFFIRIHTINVNNLSLNEKKATAFRSVANILLCFIYIDRWYVIFILHRFCICIIDAW